MYFTVAPRCLEAVWQGVYVVSLHWTGDRKSQRDNMQLFGMSEQQKRVMYEVKGRDGVRRQVQAAQALHAAAGAVVSRPSSWPPVAGGW